MRESDISAGAGKLQHALKNLRTHWLHIQAEWNDHTAQEFAETQLVPLDQKSIQAIEAISRLGQVLLQAEQECSNNHPLANADWR